MKIRLDPSDINKVSEFANSINVDERDFGQFGVAERRYNEVQDSILIGKTAEIAFKKFFDKKFNTDLYIDWKVYKVNQGDQQDFLINNNKIEIKSSKNGKWLLVEKGDIQRRLSSNMLPHFVVFINVFWDKSTRKPKGYTYINGYIPIESLLRKENFMKKGSKIPDTNTKLKANNFGIHIEDLYNNWGVLYNKIKTN